MNDFCKKFFDKTRNEWVERHEFQKVHGKYDLVEQDFGENEVAKKEKIKDEQTEVKIEPCDLDQQVQDLIQLICDVKMMENYAKELKFDIKRAPLGKLTTKQLQTGMSILTKIENILLKKSKGNLTSLSSQFYTRIPHDFGMKVPPSIRDLEHLREEADLLESLEQISVAVNLHQTGDAKHHPITKSYLNLKVCTDYDTGIEKILR